ncbi:DNA-binding response regulator [Epidermidibacterium keratini]|uniref:DNA-binding response regulator n=1 Tax=Epidermidibacterium keratini TaxID=1891644 RepID=A0A7L4YLB2_9ACTN|nr:response regulator transcription factor [Epidermidibacterium keratini]QHB99841.1 DNA-binding response regulator [Epidermidibacterium keratini]
MDITLMAKSGREAADVLPSLALLTHDVRLVEPDVSVLLEADAGDIVLVDARADLAGARSLVRMLTTTGVSAPVLAVLAEGGLIAVAADWGMDDFLLDSAGPAEVEARLRFASTRRTAVAEDELAVVTRGDLTIEEDSYAARVRGRSLDLTYKEFELLKYLAQHPGRVFSRAQLLHEVWGYDYFGGTRTVDVHVRRLRAKLGNEHEALIGTVRNVGYKFVTPPEPRDKSRERAGRDNDAEARPPANEKERVG